MKIGGVAIAAAANAPLPRIRNVLRFGRHESGRFPLFIGPSLRCFDTVRRSISTSAISLRPKFNDVAETLRYALIYARGAATMAPGQFNKFSTFCVLQCLDHCRMITPSVFQVRHICGRIRTDDVHFLSELFDRFDQAVVAAQPEQLAVKSKIAVEHRKKALRSIRHSGP